MKFSSDKSFTGNGWDEWKTAMNHLDDELISMAKVGKFTIGEVQNIKVETELFQDKVIWKTIIGKYVVNAFTSRKHKLYYNSDLISYDEICSAFVLPIKAKLLEIVLFNNNVVYDKNILYTLVNI